MKLSQLFFSTRKEAPSDCYLLSHKLLERAGYIKKLARGSFHYMPLMCRVIQKLEKLIHREMRNLGAQEVSMPCCLPATIWKESGRWDLYNAEGLLYSFSDRDDQELCMAPTHEEAVTHLVKNQVTSYKQLPLLLYQINTKFRDEIRPRFGLMRAKEFIMKDGYSFDLDKDSLSQSYERVKAAYCAILDSLELEYMAVKADAGAMGGARSEEFQVLSEVGEDELFATSSEAFNIEALTSIPPEPKVIDQTTAEQIFESLKDHQTTTSSDETKKTLSLCIETPEVKDMEALAHFLKEKVHNEIASIDQTVKTLIYKASYPEHEEFAAVVIRGDRSVSEIKLKNLLGATVVELASEEEVERIAGTKPGYVGPDLPIRTLYDNTVRSMRFFTAACNQSGKHRILANWGCDYKDCEETLDLLLSKEGDLCAKSGEPLVRKRGIEVGHIFELGQRYAKSLDATFLDQNGKKQPFYMGCYGIGLTRLIAAAVEQKSTEAGIVWPKQLAPFHVLLTAVSIKDEDQVQGAKEIYESLQEWGCEVLLDDRNERLGFKMKDAALIGIPIRLIIGKKWVESRLIEVEGLPQCESVTKENLLSLIENYFI